MVENVPPFFVNYSALYSRRKDYVAASLTYTVEFSADLTTWEASNAAHTVVADDGSVQAVTVPYTFFMSDGQKAQYFRVTVSIAP